MENGGALSKKKVSPKRISYKKQIDDLISQFSEDFCNGKIPKVYQYLDYFHGSPKDKRELFELLISTKLAYLATHPEWALKEQDESISKLLALLKRSK